MYAGPLAAVECVKVRILRLDTSILKCYCDLKDGYMSPSHTPPQYAWPDSIAYLYDILIYDFVYRYITTLSFFSWSRL